MYPLYEKRARNLVPYLILMPALLLFVIFQLIPSFATVAFSFTDITRTGYKAVEFIGLDNYREFFRPATFRDKGIAMKNSIVFTVLVVLLQNTLGLLVALILNRQWKGRSFFRASIFLPIILGITVNALVWRLMFNPFDGPVQLLLKSVFNTESLFFGSPELAFPLIIFVQIWSYMGYSAVIFLAGLQAIPESLYEAAGIDGAGPWRQFWNVTFPLIAQAVTVNVLLAIIGALRTFDTIYVTTNGQFDTQTMAFYMFDQAFSMSGGAGGGRLGFASAVATILFLFILIVATIAQWYLRRREIEL
jgi:raffinose/stachyose/melibiose transport system permease protein